MDDGIERATSTVPGHQPQACMWCHGSGIKEGVIHSQMYTMYAWYRL